MGVQGKHQLRQSKVRPPLPRYVPTVQLYCGRHGLLKDFHMPKDPSLAVIFFLNLNKYFTPIYIYNAFKEKLGLC